MVRVAIVPFGTFDDCSFEGVRPWIPGKDIVVRRNLDQLNVTL
jgi:hypothetical protein